MAKKNEGRQIQSPKAKPTGAAIGGFRQACVQFLAEILAEIMPTAPCGAKLLCQSNQASAASRDRGFLDRAWGRAKKTHGVIQASVLVWYCKQKTKDRRKHSMQLSILPRPPSKNNRLLEARGANLFGFEVAGDFRIDELGPDNYIFKIKDGVPDGSGEHFFQPIKLFNERQPKCQAQINLSLKFTDKPFFQ